MAKVLIEYLIQRLDEVGAIKVKKVIRTGVDQATIQLAEPLNISKLYGVKHQNSRYYPDGLAGNYVEIEYAPKNGDTVLHVNIH